MRPRDISDNQTKEISRRVDDSVHPLAYLSPMAPQLSKDLRDRVMFWHTEYQYSYRKLAELAGCSIGTITNILMYHRIFGSSVNPFGRRPGRSRELDEEDRGYLEHLLQREPTIYLDEIQQKFQEDRAIYPSIATIQREIKRLGITRKTISKEALERNDLLRAIWEGNMAQYDDPELFVFLDESAVNNLSTQRFAGWSTCGTPCVRRATFLRGAHYSVLPALTLDGIVALDIFEGAVNRERFLTFLREHIVQNLSSFSWNQLMPTIYP